MKKTIRYSGQVTILIFILCLLSDSQAQNINSICNKIDLLTSNIVNNDFIHEIDLSKKDIDNTIDLSAYFDDSKLANAKGLRHTFVIFIDNSDNDSLYVLRINRYYYTENAIISADGKPTGEYSRIDHLETAGIRKCWDLNTNKKLTDVLKDNVKISDVTPTSIKNDINYTRSNRDFFSYLYSNDYFAYPDVLKKQAEQKNTSIDMQNQNASDKDIIDPKLINKTTLDLGLSRVAFSFPFKSIFLNQNKNDFYPSLGFEISAQEEVMNLLPWEKMSLDFGARVLLRMGNLESGNTINENTSFLDTRLFIRRKIDWKVDFNSDFKQPIINTSNAFGGKILFTRINDAMPFVSLYFVTGKRKFDEPNVRFTDGENEWAYFNFYEFESMISFFFNTDSDAQHRFKLDLGASLFDIHRANYTEDFTLLKSWTRLYWQVNPIVGLDYYLNEKDQENLVPLLGASVKVLMSRLKSSAWLKIWQFGDNFMGSQSSIRLEAFYISPSIARSKHEWENEGGYSIQFRFRTTF